MDTARQIIRWSIPGFLFFFILALNYCAMFGLPARVDDAGKSIQFPIAFFAISVIPIGFLIYQLYYWLYGNYIPWFPFVSRDKGQEVLIGTLLEGQAHMYRQQLGYLEHPSRYMSKRWLEDSRTQLSSHSTSYLNWSAVLPVHRFISKSALLYVRKYFKPGDQKNDTFRSQYQKQLKFVYQSHFHGHWDIVRYFLKYEIGESKPELINEYTTHLDIYHSLGASIVAIVSSIVVFLFLSVLFIIARLTSSFESPFIVSTAIALIAVLSISFAAWLYRATTQHKRSRFHRDFKKFRRLTARYRRALIVVFLAILFLVILIVTKSGKIAEVIAFSFVMTISIFAVKVLSTNRLHSLSSVIALLRLSLRAHILDNEEEYQKRIANNAKIVSHRG